MGLVCWPFEFPTPSSHSSHYWPRLCLAENTAPPLRLASNSGPSLGINRPSSYQFLSDTSCSTSVYTLYISHISCASYTLYDWWNCRHKDIRSNVREQKKYQWIFRTSSRRNFKQVAHIHISLGGYKGTRNISQYMCIASMHVVLNIKWLKHLSDLNTHSYTRPWGCA